MMAVIYVDILAIDLISRADYAAHLHNDVTGWRQNIAVFAV